MATRETEHLDHEAMIAAFQGFDVAFDHLTLAEKREFIQLMCKHVELRPDHVVVELYEGRMATRYLTGNKRLQNAGDGVPGEGGGVPGAVPGEREGREQKQRTPDRGPGFVFVGKWLPTTGARHTLGRRGRPVFWCGVPLSLSRIKFKKEGRKGKKRRVSPASRPSAESTRERLAALIDGVTIRTRADLARHLGVSRAYVTQVLGPVVHAVHAEREDVPHREADDAREGGA